MITFEFIVPLQLHDVQVMVQFIVKMSTHRNRIGGFVITTGTYDSGGH
jgi:hypothetical protein